MKLDQYFLNNKEVAKKLVEAAETKKKDVVLEIGAGRGFITEEIAKKAGKVIAVEIDESFKRDLKKLPKNVDVYFDDINRVLDEKIKFNKVISNLPSSLAEPLAKRFINENFEVMSLLLPLKIFHKLNDPFFSVYYDSFLIGKLEKESFSPPTRTSWAIVKIIRKKEPLFEKDWERYLRKYLYEHPSAKLKNSLMEAIVRIYQSKGKALTKNQAREIISSLNLSLEEPVSAQDIPSVSQKIVQHLSN